MAKSKRIEVELADRTPVGALGAGTAASRRVWTSTTVDSSAPTLKSEGYETNNARTALVTVKCVGGTNATFTLYAFYGDSETWLELADYGTAGAYTVSAGNTHIEQVTIPCGCTRLHLQATAKTLSPTEISGWLTLGY